ncbi:MAG: cold shock domain-containing protein [Gemmatimonadota bacterium]|nr:cold shock domain-containing protein [Gemmatimonadota bacterium]
MGRVRGEVKWFDAEKGWGFIRLAEGKEVFVHHSDILGEGFRTLNDGDAVELEVEEADRGPRARRVVREGEEPPAAEPDRAPAEARPERGERPGREPKRTGRASRGSGTPGDDVGTPRRGTEAPGGDDSLDAQVRRALGDRYPFAR